jgi:transcriptional regulator with XRE-family HTH domain
MDDNRIGTVIRAKREKKNYSQEHLDELIGKSSGYIGQVERGETIPSTPMLKKIIEVLGIDANTLYFNTESNQPVSHEISIRASRLSPKKQEFILNMISLVERSFREDEPQ